MKSYTPSQKKYLKGLSHNVNASVILGKSGLTPALIDEIRCALAAHELIKVKCNKSKDQKETFSSEIVEQTEAFLVSIIGNYIVLYKQAKNPEDRKISLPK